MMNRSIRLSCILALIGTLSCQEMPVPEGDAGLPDDATLNVAVRSADASDDEVASLSVWAYACDVQGNVTDVEPLAYSFSDESTATLEFVPGSRYCLVAAASDAGLDEAEVSFAELSTISSDIRNGKAASHWKVVDLMPQGAVDENIDIDMEIFRTVGRVSLSVRKSDNLMQMLITDVSVCSVAAPVAGAVFSKLTPEQIKGTGRENAEWWFDGFTPATAAFSESFASDISLPEAGTYTTAGSINLFENRDGWTDLSAFASEGFNISPAETDPDCAGYFLALSYRYTVIPGLSPSKDSESVTEEKKYIPLAPVLRGNDYHIKVTVDLGEIVVTGNTEVSVENDGQW